MLHCSVDCIKRHKVDKNCTGKRSRTQFLSLGEMNARTLVEDVSYLEGQTSVLKKKKLSRLEPSNKPKAKIGNFRYEKETWNNIYRCLRESDIMFKRFKKTDSRRIQNKTSFKQSNQTILWQIEWCFHISINASPKYYMHYNVEDLMKVSDSLNEIMEVKKVKEGLAEVLKDQPSLLAWVVTMRVLKNENLTGIQLNLSDTIRQSLKEKVVYEFPTFHVFLASHYSEFESVMKAISEFKYNQKEDMEKEELDPLEQIELPVEIQSTTGAVTTTTGEESKTCLRLLQEVVSADLSFT